VSAGISNAMPTDPPEGELNRSGFAGGSNS
jgi:hypothetical protein